MTTPPRLRFFDRCSQSAVLRGLAATLSVVALSVAARAEAPTAAFAPPVSPLALAELPPGAIRPEGWLRDWALAADHGITGHLDERSNVFADAWNGQPIVARGARPDGTGWPLEQCSYWLDGGIRLAYILDDAALKAKISRRLDRVVDGVLHGGETFIYWLPRSALDVPFNSWAHSQMGRALVAYYEASRNPRVLEALVKVYRNFVLPGPNRTSEEAVGTVNVDPMIDTYLLSGDPAILAHIRALAVDPAYRAVVADWNAENIQSGHAVTFYENSRVPALLYPWTGNHADLTATQRALDWLDRNHGLPMGLSSGEEYHAGIGATRDVETCNVTAAMWTNLWLLRITGGRDYSDRIERIFFNAAPAAVDREFETLAYYQSPNRYSLSLPAELPEHPSSKTANSHAFTPLGHPVLCCVGNINRVLPYYISHLWMGTPDGGLAATLYGPGTVTATVGGAPVRVRTTTAYPFDDTIVFAVASAPAAAFPLYLRIPAWCRAPEIALNGKPVAADVTPAGFARIARTWRAGDEVRLRLPMAVVYREGNETPYPKVPYFAHSRSLAHLVKVDSPFATVSRGPLLFARPIPDLDPNTVAPAARFGYALALPRAGATPDVEVVREPMPEHWAWPLDAPVQLSVWMRPFDWKPKELQPLPFSPVTGGKRVRVRLVPYGCAKFRVTMFPIAAETPPAAGARP